MLDVGARETRMIAILPLVSAETPSRFQQFAVDQWSRVTDINSVARFPETWQSKRDGGYDSEEKEADCDRDRPPHSGRPISQQDRSDIAGERARDFAGRKVDASGGLGERQAHLVAVLDRLKHLLFERCARGRPRRTHGRKRD